MSTTWLLLSQALHCLTRTRLVEDALSVVQNIGGSMHNVQTVARLVGIASLLALAPYAAAVGLLDETQLTTSYASAGFRRGGEHRVWALRWDGILVSKGPSGWQSHGMHAWGFPGAVGGVSAVSYTSGFLSPTTEHVYMVGNFDLLYEYTAIGGGQGTWTGHSPPQGYAPAGSVAALTGMAGSTRYVAVAYTSIYGHLIVAVRNTGSPTFTYHDFGANFRTDTQLAATKSPDETVWTFFGTHYDGTVGFARYLTSGWVVGSISAPPGTTGCRSLAAAQGQRSSAAYSLNLWCAAFEQETMVRVATSYAPTSTSFGWTFTYLGDTAVSGKFSLAAATHPNPALPGYVALDGFAVSSDGRIWRDTAAGDWPWNAIDLGVPPEEGGSFPGLAASNGASGALPMVSWIGYMGGFGQPQGGPGHELYSRESTQTAPGDLSHFQAHGDGTFQHQVDPGAAFPHSESMMDEWLGNALAVAIVRPNWGDGNPDDDYSFTQAFWSGNDGATWNAPVTLPSTVNGLSYSYVSDPVVTFTAAGTAYVALLGLNRVGDCSPDYWDREAVYFTTTQDGLTYSTPTVLEQGSGMAKKLDHEWAASQLGSNRVHFVWSSTAGMKYRCTDHGATCPTTSGPCCTAPCTSPPCLGPTQVLATSSLGPPTATVGGDGTVYVSWLYANTARIRICRLNTALTGCVSVVDSPVQQDYAGISIPGTANHAMRGIQGWSLVASRSQPGVVYLALHQQEPLNIAKDIVAMRGVWNPSTLNFTWSSPVLVPGVGADAINQFNPALTILADGTAGSDDTLMASWYAQDEACAGYSNRCLRAKSAVSRDGALTWTDQRTAQMGEATDPELLPFHCKDPANERFLGDYHENRGAYLHSHHVFSVAPASGPATSARLWSTFVSPASHLH